MKEYTKKLKNEIIEAIRYKLAMGANDREILAFIRNLFSEKLSKHYGENESFDKSDLQYFKSLPEISGYKH